MSAAATSPDDSEIVRSVYRRSGRRAFQSDRKLNSGNHPHQPRTRTLSTDDESTMMMQHTTHTLSSASPYVTRGDPSYARSASSHSNDSAQLNRSSLASSSHDRSQSYNMINNNSNSYTTYETTPAIDLNNETVLANMRIMFAQFDKDNDGKITRNEINFVMSNLFPEEKITSQDIDSMLKAADLDNNGFIDFDGLMNAVFFYILIM